MQASKEKLTITGHYLEHDVFEQPIFYGADYHRKHKPTGRSLSTPEENEEKSVNRTKVTVRRLVNANVRTWLKPNKKPFKPIFITLTFKSDIRDVNQANQLFTDFIQRLNYFIFGTKKHDLRYVTVIEFQDLNRDGVIHYHTLFFNLKFIDKIYDEIKRIWQNGNTNIKPVDKVKNLGRYLVKYMTKNIKDGRLKGRKKYFTSRGLYRWQTIYDPDKITYTIKEFPKNCIEGSSSWVNTHCGKITRTTYNLENHPPAIAWLNKIMIK